MTTLTIQQAFDLAIQHHQAGRLVEAEALYRQILAVQPGSSFAMHYIGVIAHQTGRHDLAVNWIGQAVSISPNDAAAHANLGAVFRALGRLDEAIAAYGRGLHLDPNNCAALVGLAEVYRLTGRLEEAVAACRRALILQPDYADAFNNLGVALRDQGKLADAAAALQAALQLNPSNAPAHNNLGGVFCEMEKLDEAVAAYERALELKADYPEAHNNLGGALKDRGAVAEAVEAYRRALQLQPQNATAQSNLIYTLCFQPDEHGRAVIEERQRWNRTFGEPLRPFIQPHTNDRNAGRRLRIGYVSPDFRGHVVGRNLAPLFREHDHEAFEILCYSGVVQPDSLTEEFRQRSGQWRAVAGLRDEVLAAMIRQDRVDILVDLSQHTSGNRLPMFALKPAPVQVSFAGYPESTGLETIGCRISDRWMEKHGIDPAASEQETDRLGPGSEERVFLIDSFWCYDPCGMDVETNALPAQETGTVTFGSLNKYCKINEPMLRLWARILGVVKDARLVLLSGFGSHRRQALEIFEQAGIAAQRVEFVEWQSRRAYLELYRRIDIAFDPFPYNGHTTSLDALWMGVPVVSLCGERAVSRAGWSQLSNLGLPELVAFSEDEYAAIASELAHDLPRLAELRRTLRPRMESSVLMDAPRFTRGIEAAYRAMWHRWCRPPKTP